MNLNFVVVPASVLRSDKLSPTEKFLYSLAVTLPRGIQTSDAALAKAFGSKERTISNAIVSLKKNKLLTGTRNRNGGALVAVIMKSVELDLEGTSWEKEATKTTPEIGNHSSQNREPEYPKSGSEIPEIGSIYTNYNKDRNNISASGLAFSYDKVVEFINEDSGISQEEGDMFFKEYSEKINSGLANPENWKIDFLHFVVNPDRRIGGAA